MVFKYGIFAVMTSISERLQKTADQHESSYKMPFKRFMEIRGISDPESIPDNTRRKLYYDWASHHFVFLPTKPKQ